jgi:cytochrome oxidase Cu insertion factor (SCO1/SenC/PrrC family)
MPGMSRSLQSGNPTIISAFHTALIHQLVLIALVVAVLSVGWNLFRSRQMRRSSAGGWAAPVAVTAQGGGAGSGAGGGAVTDVTRSEPIGRRVLRIGFGLTWILDGLLQIQSGMVLGLPNTVLRPAAAGSPAWVRSLVGVGATIWSNHPVQAAASAVWIQLGIGILLLVAPRGWWSRFAGATSFGWAMVVWIFGEAFGSIFAPGLTWAFGAPGAALFYAAAGALIALPDDAWRRRRLGRLVCAGLGLFFAGMALLQAWPGRGSWQGRIGHSQGPLAAMAAQMAQTPQPHFLSGWVRSFSNFDAAHGWGVNLFLVVALSAIGIALCTGRTRPVLFAVGGAVVLCLADWVLVEDFGFFGGVGTDPNSMVPMLLLVVGGGVALVRAPATAAVPAAVAAPRSGAEAAVGFGGHLRDDVAIGYVGRVLAAVAATVVIVVGAVPMASASTNPNADPILSVALDGAPNLVDAPAPPFTLTDQHGRSVSLAGLRGKAIALTFLDPVCTSDCPVIAQELRRADSMLGAQSARVAFVAVASNPIYHSVTTTRAFDRQEGLTRVGNWLYLTGSLAALKRVWTAYGVEATVAPAGAMVAHTEAVYVIDPGGHTRVILNATPGTGNATTSSFATLVTDQVRSVLSR